jgi:hypothetical protein
MDARATGVIAPDPIARDYLLLALRLDRLVPGLVDGYFGPADLRAQVAAEEPPDAARLRADVVELRGRVEVDVREPDRRRWLRAQLVALETQARALGGDPLPYLAHVSACFDFTPERTDEAVFAAAAEDLDRLLPGEGPVAVRAAAWDERFTVPPDRLRAVLDALLPGFRERARPLFGLPPGEDLTVSLVRGRPWSGYNWYDGGLRSRVEINTDLPTRAADLLSVLPHETYPGHHLEHAWHEARLVREAGRLEASVLCINAPECLLSEGIADLGRRFAVPAADEVDLLVEIYRLAGLADARDQAAARAAGEAQAAITSSAAALGGVRGNAALLLHADGASREEVLAYLERHLLTTPERAAKRLGFIDHPLWRTYVFVYFEGERLLSRWLERVPPAEQAARFRRLLVEQLTPDAILDELGASAPTR